jgi:hypothetical protein
MNTRLRRITRCVGGAVLLALAAIEAGAPAAATADGAPVSPVASAWQHRKVEFQYFGVTTLYTCDGLEAQVGRILQFLGARKDLRVRALGCDRGPNAPSHTASVTADFYSLATSADSHTPGTVQAQWSPLELVAQRPSFMSDGDCELLEDMKSLISQSFTVRSLDYRAECTPRQVDIGSYRIKGEFLRLVPPGAG